MESYIQTDQEFKTLFTHTNGTRLIEGDWIKREKYADALESIAKDGINVFYSGWIAESLVDTIQKSKGIATLKDFKAYHANINPAITGSYKGKRIITSPLPTSGPVMLTILNILERFDFPNRKTHLYYHQYYINQI